MRNGPGTQVTDSHPGFPSLTFPRVIDISLP